jgi:tetratricopeptide (TPR) repeat protein
MPNSRPSPRRQPPWRARLALCILAVGVLALGGTAVWLYWLGPVARAKAALERGETRLALAMARAELDRHPGNRRASLLAARCLSKLGTPLAAELHYRNAGILSLSAQHERAFALLAAREPARASAIYEDILKRWPGDPTALQRLAALEMSRQRWDRAIPLATQLTQLSEPENVARGYTLLAVLEHESHHGAKAIAASEQVLRLDPALKYMPLPPQVFWRNLALDLIGEGRARDASRHLERILEQERDPVLIELLGLAYSELGQTADAEKSWRMALELDPTLSDAWLDIGRLALRNGKAVDAASAFRKAVELSPSAAEPLYLLSQALRQTGYHQEADQLDERREALLQTPSNKVDLLPTVLGAP